LGRIFFTDHQKLTNIIDRFVAATLCYCTFSNWQIFHKEAENKIFGLYIIILGL